MLKQQRKLAAFTMVEMIVVLAVVMILGVILFPVMSAAKSSAKRTICATNMKNSQLAVLTYLTDYDDRFMLVNYRPGQRPDYRKDRTWVQMLLPYAKSFSTFHCTEDRSNKEKEIRAFEPDAVLGDTDAKIYYASFKVNQGYNYLYYSPIFMQNGVWVSNPKSMSEIEDPSAAMIFVDSTSSTAANSKVHEGGYYIVVPPCRYIKSGNTMMDSFNAGVNQLLVPTRGWNLTSGNPSLRYGFAWPWHLDKVNTTQVMGGIKALNIQQLTNGCDVKNEWAGYIDSTADYPWDGE